MEIMFQHSPAEMRKMETKELRSAFLTSSLMHNDDVRTVYTHYDRMIAGGAMPVSRKLVLETDNELRALYFLERRELGIINIGGRGTVHADGKGYMLENMDGLYAGMGTRDILFESIDPANPALFYLLSAPAHKSYPVQLVTADNALPTLVGSPETCNERTVYKYIHGEGIKSCQLVMGLTVLNRGSVWNTMPAHTHSRRMEVYYYFNIPEGQRVFHFMGEPTETRHLIVGNHQAVFSPAWSLHSGCGTSNYAFIWGMAGENYSYTDMDIVETKDLK